MPFPSQSSGRQSSSRKSSVAKRRKFDKRGASSTKVKVEELESRRLLASFGTPWPDAQSLTISFPADGVAVQSKTNDIHSTLASIATEAEWQELSLRAFQTWAYHADINVGLRSDHGLDFGAPGLIQSDPRFGDFRIGAIPQTRALANSLPYQEIAGTFSGDLYLNSNQTFTFHDWADNSPPDPATLPNETYDLFSLLLHETGNTLGVEDNLQDWTVMFGQYTVPKGVLSQEDIDEIQSLYGIRSDPYELVDNGQIQVATTISTPVGFQPANDVIQVSGSLVNSNDVDTYQIIPVAQEGSVQIRLNASGRSLLKSRVEIIDSTGQILSDQTVSSVFDNDLTFTVNNLMNYSELFVRVSSADSDVYSVGDYELQIDYRSNATIAADPAPGGYNDGIESLWTNYALVDDEQLLNDTIATAADATLSPGTTSGHSLGIVSSLGATSTGTPDIDVWKITSPSDLDGPLMVHLSSVGSGSAELNIQILDSSGLAVSASGRLRPDGTWSLEVAQPTPNTDYFIEVSVDPNSVVSVGNYVATANFMATSDQMNEMVTRTISDDDDEFVRWTAAKSKIYRFDLSVEGVSSDEGVQLTIYDAHTLEMRMVLGSPSGTTRTAFAMLDEGDYIFRFTAFSHSGADVSAIDFSLSCDGLSDDQDPYDPYGPGYDDNYNIYYYYDLDPVVSGYLYYSYGPGGFYYAPPNYTGPTTSGGGDPNNG